MKFTCSVEINQNIEKVVALFANPDYLAEYQDGFIRKELISGTEGEQGAVSKIFYKQGKGTMELTETVKENKLPDLFVGFYHHKHMDNYMKSSFTELNSDKTRYEAEIEYTAFRGFIPKLMATLFSGMFKKQVQHWLNNFKAFAEKQ